MFRLGVRNRVEQVEKRGWCVLLGDRAWKTIRSEYKRSREGKDVRNMNIDTCSRWSRMCSLRVWLEACFGWLKIVSGFVDRIL